MSSFQARKGLQVVFSMGRVSSQQTAPPVLGRFAVSPSALSWGMVLGRFLLPDSPIAVGLAQVNRALAAAGGWSPVVKHQNLLVSHRVGSNWRNVAVQSDAGALQMGGLAAAGSKLPFAKPKCKAALGQQHSSSRGESTMKCRFCEQTAPVARTCQCPGVCTQVF